MYILTKIIKFCWKTEKYIKILPSEISYHSVVFLFFFTISPLLSGEGLVFFFVFFFFFLEIRAAEKGV